MTVAVIEFAPWPSRRRLYSRKYLSLLLLIPSGIMFLAHGLSAHLDAVGIVHQAVEDGGWPNLKPRNYSSGCPLKLPLGRGCATVGN